MKNKYDPLDIPVLMRKGRDGSEGHFVIFRCGLMWCTDSKRMLDSEEVAEVFELLKYDFGRGLDA